MNRTLRAVLIINNGQDKLIQDITFKDCLEDIYQLLDCELFEVATRYINGVPYSLLVDEEGIYNKRGLISAVARNQTEYLLGNIIIVGAGADDDGNMIGLTNIDIKRITQAYNPTYKVLIYDFR